MKGHIRQRSPGHWAIVLEIRDAESGRRKRKWHSFKGTKREAQKECARLITEIERGTHVEPTRETVASFLERWIEHMQGQVSPRTIERYAELCRKNIVPLLGGLILTKLQPAQISQAYAKALTSGRRDGTGGLSARSVGHMHRVLRQALQQALRWQLIARNPTDVVRPPKVERQEMHVVDANGAIDLIEAARGTVLFVPILLGVRCGMRRGEVVALRWRNVDLERGQFSVVASAEQTAQGVREKDPKNGKGRIIVLSPSDVEELRSHRLAQAQRLFALGVRLTDDHHVVDRGDGYPLKPRSLSNAFRQFLLRHGLPEIRLHDLRHSHATHMLAAGVHPKIAQERLGHSSVGITLDLYSHVLPGMQAEAVSRVDDVFQAALKRRDR